MWREHAWRPIPFLGSYSLNDLVVNHMGLIVLVSVRGREGDYGNYTRIHPICRSSIILLETVQYREAGATDKFLICISVN